MRLAMSGYVSASPVWGYHAGRDNGAAEGEMKVLE